MSQRILELKHILEHHSPETPSSQIMILEDELISLEDKNRLDRFYADCGIGEMYLGANLDQLKDSNIIEKVGKIECVLNIIEFNEEKPNIEMNKINLYDTLMKYVEDGLNHISNGNGIIVNGPIASGKTYAAIALVFEIINKVRLVKFDRNNHPRKSMPSFHFISMQDIIALIGSKQFKSESTLDEIRNKDILIIDDMATENHNIFAKELEQFVYLVLKFRDNKNLMTIITTNCITEKFILLYGKRAASILCGKRFNHISIKTEKSWRMV